MKTVFPLKACRAGAGPAAAGSRLGRLAAMSIVTLAASVSAAAAAHGLGDIAVSSRLGEPLRAIVALISAEPAGLESQCIKLVPHLAGGDEPPWLANARFDVERKKGAARLHIATDAAVTAPVLMVGLSVGCDIGLRRDYAVFLAPPVSAAVGPDIPATPSKALEVPGDDKRSTRERLAAEPAKDDTHTVHPMLRPLKAEAPSVRGAAPGMPRQPTPLPADLPRADREGASNDHARAEAERPLAPPDPTAQPVALAETIRQMENTLASLQEAVRETETAIANATLNPAPAMAPEPTRSPTGPLARPASIASDPPSTKVSSPPPWWLLFVAAGLATLLVAILRRRRRRRGDTPGPDYRDPQRLEGQSAGESRPPLPQEKPVAIGADTPALTAPVGPARPSFAATEDHRIDVAEHESALDLAEILLSFGRVEGAAQALADHIDAHPKQTVRPWLRLLEVYREGGMRAEFDSLARRLNQTFNIEVMAWQQQPRRRDHDCLQNYPHIVARLLDTWGTPACQAYLRHLLNDNRNGTRTGFPAEVLDEILLLANILERIAEMPVPVPLAEIQPQPTLGREAPGAPVTGADGLAGVDVTTSPAAARRKPRPLLHLLAGNQHRLPQHPHVPNVVG